MTSTRLPFGSRRRSARGEPVYHITGARRGVHDDVDSRTRKYLVSMGVRTACFLLAVVTDGWLRWVFIAGAVILPYLSVVFANGGRERVENLPHPSDPIDAGDVATSRADLVAQPRAIGESRP